MARASLDALAVERKRLEEAIVAEKRLLKEAENHEKMGKLMKEAGWKVVKGRKSVRKVRKYKEHDIIYYETIKQGTVEEWPGLTPKKCSVAPPLGVPGEKEVPQQVKIFRAIEPEGPEQDGDGR